MKRFLVALLLCGAVSWAQAQEMAVPPTPSAPTPGAGTPSGTLQPIATATPVPTAKPFLTPTPKPTALPISAAEYRARLQTALDKVKQVEKRPPSDVRNILKPLDKPFVVQRADGKKQSVKGDEWNRLTSGVAGPNAAKLSREQTSIVRGSLEKRIAEVDGWTTTRGGGYYTSFDAQKVVNDAIASRQIRVGPPPLQQLIINATSAILTGLENFLKWLASLWPKPKFPTPTATMPNLSWLWFVFWAVMIGLLGVLLFLAARALSGGSFTLWGIGKRRKKSAEEMRDEDAELFQLAPEELRDRADMFAAQGNFREALRHRFISLLVLLDARGTWRYDIRRTNWEHIAALRKDESKRPLVAPLSELTRAFDRVRYGDAPCDEEGWNSFQTGVHQIEAQVGGRAVAR
ncbi:DUF4129 domain-containing protein [bacterium]|nr:MAG: DUF4129 domain-containing protein [bacterium]